MQEDDANKDGKKRSIRCAVYTRKSTSEGLEQEFNSLDAQRESCEKFIQSQKGEGWTLWPERFDDGGFSGGNTDRPALQKLLEAVRANRVDCVVVYKVDRLSRSLLDFSRIVELFEQHGVAFCAVTQQFSTNTSMGRLTLNVLLSFAQFEREIISERIRDKMSAARKRGKWTGGCAPLGYDIDREKKRLVVNPEEARIVRQIFDLYLEKRSILEVVRELNARGLTTKRRVSKTGNRSGGGPFMITNLQHLLANPVYVGKTEVNGELFQGEHEAILPEEVYRAVERLRKENFRHRSAPNRKGPAAFLKGLLRCRACGAAMIHSYTQKDGRKYRYYTCSRAMKQGFDTCPDPTVNALAMEEAATACLKKVMEGQEGLRDFFAFTWDSLFPAERARIFRTALEGLDYDGKTGALSLRLSERGMQDLVREIVPAQAEVA